MVSNISEAILSIPQDMPRKSSTKDTDANKEVPVEYVKIRAARAGNKPPLVLPVPREIVDRLNIEAGQTFIITIDDRDRIIVVRPEKPKV